jgi:hypothetical protein
MAVFLTIDACYELHKRKGDGDTDGIKVYVPIIRSYLQFMEPLMLHL